MNKLSRVIKLLDSIQHVLLSETKIACFSQLSKQQSNKSYTNPVKILKNKLLHEILLFATYVQRRKNASYLKVSMYSFLRVHRNIKQIFKIISLLKFVYIISIYFHSNRILKCSLSQQFLLLHCKIFFKGSGAKERRKEKIISKNEMHNYSLNYSFPDISNFVIKPKPLNMLFGS